MKYVFFSLTTIRAFSILVLHSESQILLECRGSLLLQLTWASPNLLRKEGLADIGLPMAALVVSQSLVHVLDARVVDHAVLLHVVAGASIALHSHGDGSLLLAVLAHGLLAWGGVDGSLADELARD